MIISKVNSNDLVQIQSMAQVIWNHHYPEIIGQDQVDYMLNRMYDLESLKQQLEQGHVFFNAENLGFISVQPMEDGWFLNKLYVMPNLQRSGVGRALLDFVIIEFDIKTLRLQVNRQNYKAINFYFKYGFIIEKVADFDIGDGYQMNDFIMVWGR
jgi:ribosomal protein S18 acetylase RimI-like enzyme